MRSTLRQAANWLFSMLAAGAVLAVTLALILILAPMLWRGAGAMIFRGTLEFRRLQLEQFGRGDDAQVRAEIARAAQYRVAAYDILDRFGRGIDTSEEKQAANKACKEFTDQVKDRPGLDADQQGALLEKAQNVRDALLLALAATDKDDAARALGRVLKSQDDPRFKDTPLADLFRLAREYQTVLADVDLGWREKYGPAFAEVKTAVADLLGPRPGRPVPPLLQQQYGSTRWDMASKQLATILWAEQWQDRGARELRVKVLVPRSEQFAGTPLAALFPIFEQHADEMIGPRWTCYWQFLIDSDKNTAHFFGGVGPEILGTLLITVLTILVAFPLGLVAAGYLVECAKDGPLVVVIRTCINTLAGVPSIVFGLFGLAFFVLFLLPQFGMTARSSILAGALTLAILVLPVIIRASEEAIRAVPKSYKEGALALGASPFRTFVTVTLPAALPGILTGVILSMSRAAGETAPLLFTAAVATGGVPTSLTQPTKTLSYGAYDMASGDRIAKLVPHNQYGMVITLVVLVLLLNIVAIVLRSRVARKLRGH